MDQVVLLVQVILVVPVKEKELYAITFIQINHLAMQTLETHR